MRQIRLPVDSVGCMAYFGENVYALELKKLKDKLPTPQTPNLTLIIEFSTSPPLLQIPTRTMTRLYFNHRILITLLNRTNMT